jgi:hypothetical protein
MGAGGPGRSSARGWLSREWLFRPQADKEGMVPPVRRRVSSLWCGTFAPAGLLLMAAAEPGNWQSAYKAARCRARVAFLFRATMEVEPCDEGKPTWIFCFILSRRTISQIAPNAGSRWRSPCTKPGAIDLTFRRSDVSRVRGRNGSCSRIEVLARRPAGWLHAWRWAGQKHAVRNKPSLCGLLSSKVVRYAEISFRDCRRCHVGTIGKRNDREI